jgi:hypothetical protein
MTEQRLALVLLQNAWSTYYQWVDSGWPVPARLDPDRVWRRGAWLAAFHHSRSGRRWRTILEPALPDIRFHFDNTTPRVAGESAGAHPPDRDYVGALLAGGGHLGRAPDLVVACGKQAARAAQSAWGGQLLVLPHPAHRVLTDALMYQARLALETGDFERLELVQLVDGVRRQPVPRPLLSLS